MYGNLRVGTELAATIYKANPPVQSGMGAAGLVVTLDNAPVDVSGDGEISAPTATYAVKQYGYTVRAEIRLYYRNLGKPGDGEFVTKKFSGYDGTWSFTGLNKNLKFDIIARLDGARDVIISGVAPQ